MTDYIEIHDWDKFQHADATKRGANPKWIRIYTLLHSDDDWFALTPHQRAVLVGLWLEYARSGCQLAANTASLTRRLGLRVSTQQLKALETKGFITIRQDNVKTLSSLEERREEKTRALTLQEPTAQVIDINSILEEMP